MRSKALLKELRAILKSDDSVTEQTLRKLELLSEIAPPVTDKGWEFLLILVSDVAYCPYCIELKERLGVEYVKDYCREHCELIRLMNRFGGKSYEKCTDIELVIGMIDAAAIEDIEAFRKACSDALREFSDVLHHDIC